MSTQNNSWNWDNIGNASNNIGDIFSTGLDLFGQFQNIRSNGSNTEGQQPTYYVQQPPQQQAGFGINNKTLITLGAMALSGMILKSLLDRPPQKPVT